MAGQPSVTADESEMSFPLVHVTCGYSLEVQPLPVARGPILHRALRFPLFILAKLCCVYLVPQSTALMV